MIAVVAALALLALALCLLDLILTLGVIRRLRQHTEKLANLSAMGGPAPSIMIGTGERAGEFTATTTDGEPVSRELLSGQTLVGVLSPDCSACKERLPEFISRAETFPGGRGQVLAVLAGEPEQVEEYREQLAPVARVVIEAPIEGPIATALKVQGWPAFGVLDPEGTMLAEGLDPAGSPAAV